MYIRFVDWLIQKVWIPALEVNLLKILVLSKLAASASSDVALEVASLVNSKVDLNFSLFSSSNAVSVLLIKTGVLTKLLLPHLDLPHVVFLQFFFTNVSIPKKWLSCSQIYCHSLLRNPGLWKPTSSSKIIFQKVIILIFISHPFPVNNL